MPKILTTKTVNPVVGQSPIHTRYQLNTQLGEGSYGCVYHCKDRVNGSYVAIKKIKDESKFFPQGEGGALSTNTIREISILRCLKHRNLIRMLEAVYEENDIYIIFEHMKWDLRRYLKTDKLNGRNANRRKRFILYSILRALNFLHSRRIIHRDLKPGNILIDDGGNVKVADFGLSRPTFIPEANMTNEVVTLWYRAPELVLNSKKYSSAVDIWSAGCIFAELYTGKALFYGCDNDLDILIETFKKFGFPTNSNSPFVKRVNEVFSDIPRYKEDNILVSFEDKMDANELDLFQKMMRVVPEERITAKMALRHPMFSEFHVRS